MNRPNPVVALYPGSFDPITRGHEDIARRALRVADRVIVAVAHTSTHEKKGLFEVQERVEMIRSVFDGESQIEVMSFTGLMVDLAKDQGAHLVVRGLRAVSDFEYELQMAQMNQELNPALETLFLVPEVNNSFVSSSLVRQVAALGGDVSAFVSPPVFDRLIAKFSEE
ncbi:pantetheine-phosphate adenylyltransferase [Gemmatimonadales bacterium]|jgi:pantetheine-phosphate adenylyltransferase|nr:pantetheine-phosphate adenylyltransferase [Gemmatimonadales bacterium]MDC0160785.1 pantetheine-phosphate adenylyltransferase [Gemmatimonadales bacterium]